MNLTKEQANGFTKDGDRNLSGIDSSPVNGEDEGDTAADVSTPNPWPNAVNGADLLDDMKGICSQHIILPQYGDAAFSLWALHTHVYDVFEITPRLFLRSPTRRCGKTRSLRLLKKLVRKPSFAADVTPASLFADMDAIRPTLLLDEWDSMPYANELRNAFNSGFDREGQVRRKNGTFSTFTPIAIASITPLHPTMEDRSIKLALKRKRPEETVKHPRDFDGTEIVSKCMRWANDHRGALEQARPSIPQGLDDRAADIWVALLAIADEVGGRWPTLARRAALALSLGRDDIGREEQLLRDIRDAFEQETALFSDELVKRLVAKPDARWGAEGLNEWTLADTLSNFSIHPKPIRKGKVVRRGYRRAMFEDAWSRWA